MTTCRFGALFALLLFASGLACGADAPVCVVCKGQIQGSYKVLRKDGKSLSICGRCSQTLERSAPTCALCKEKIRGSYRRITRGKEDFAVCNRCVKSGNACKRCKTPVSRDKAFCDHCETTMPHCDLCNKRLFGAYIKFGDKEKYCQSCGKGQRCPLCRRPADGTVAVGGQVVCSPCKEVARSCSSCGSLIKGKYFVHSFVDGIFCETCETTKPHCSACSRPIDGKVIKIGGKRPVCSICLPHVILDVNRFEGIYAEATAFLQENLGESIYHKPSLKAVEDIGAVRKKAGFVRKSGEELGLFQRVNHDYRIFILYGITTQMAYETIPHEWAHAWFAENGNPKHLQWVEEGFCQWVASKMLSHKGFNHGLQILASRNDLYGKGFRHIKAIEDKGGIRAVLKYVRQPPPVAYSR